MKERPPRGGLSFLGAMSASLIEERVPSSRHRRDREGRRQKATPPRRGDRVSDHFELYRNFNDIGVRSFILTGAPVSLCSDSRNSAGKISCFQPHKRRKQFGSNTHDLRENFCMSTAVRVGAPAGYMDRPPAGGPRFQGPVCNAAQKNSLKRRAHSFVQLKPMRKILSNTSN